MITIPLASTLTHVIVVQVFALAGVGATLPVVEHQVPEAPAPVLVAQAEVPIPREKIEALKAAKAKAKADAAAKPAAKPAAKTPATPSSEGDAAAMLTTKVQTFYEKTADFTATFVQHYTYKVLGRSTKSSGKVAFKKPGLMRWDYETPRKKAFIVDGDTLWVYTPEDHTVIKRPDFQPDSLSSSITFLWGKGDLASEFDITLVDAATLKLVPKTPQSGFARLRFVVDPKTGQVLESTVIDAQGNTNHLVFGEAKLNTGLSTEGFQFTPPKGVSLQVLGADGLQ